MSECVGSALLHKGFKAAPDKFIGIFAQNRPEVVTVRGWATTAQRILHARVS